MTRKIVIFGAGQHAAVVADAIAAQNRYDLLAFVDDSAPSHPQGFESIALFSSDALRSLLDKESDVYGVMGIGTNFLREAAVSQVENDFPNLKWATVIHPSAVCSSSAKVGKGSVVCMAASIGVRTNIGSHTIVNSGSNVDHDSTFGSFASCGPGVTTGGSCSVGARSFVGIGSTLVHGTVVGDDTVIGGHSLVLGSCESSSVYYGAPAKRVRKRAPNEPYL